MIKHSDWVTSDYFRTVGLTIKQGRGFGPEDSARSRRVSVINETMAQRYFPGQNPIGKRWGNSSNFAVDGIEIVGVVEDARYNDVKAESVSMSYVPAVQSERYLRSIEVRTTGDPTALANAVRHALRESEPRLAIGAIETLDERIVRSMAVERLLGWLTMTFGGAALGLACLGLYGTISFAVKRRTAELGVRIALGADRSAVQWLIVREALLLVLVGGAIGLPLAFLAARALGGLLYATPPSDPVAYMAAVGVLVVVAAFAAYIPGTASVAPRSDGGTADGITSSLDGAGCDWDLGQAMCYGFGKPKTTSVVPGFENGVSCPPAATATMSRPLAVVKTSGVARALVGS